MNRFLVEREKMRNRRKCYEDKYHKKPSREYEEDYEYDKPRHKKMKKYEEYDYEEDEDEEDIEYKSMAKMWEETLDKLIHRLKRYDRFKVNEEYVSNKARQMGINFDNFSEKELYATYLMQISDNEDISSDVDTYIKLAINFLCDDDVERQYSEKLCAYYYFIVKGESFI